MGDGGQPGQPDSFLSEPAWSFSPPVGSDHTDQASVLTRIGLHGPVAASPLFLLWTIKTDPCRPTQSCRFGDALTKRTKCSPAPWQTPPTNRCHWCYLSVLIMLCWIEFWPKYVRSLTAGNVSRLDTPVFVRPQRSQSVRTKPAAMFRERSLGFWDNNISPDGRTGCHFLFLWDFISRERCSMGSSAENSRVFFRVTSIRCLVSMILQQPPVSPFDKQ